jgi:hypothetical protein
LSARKELIAAGERMHELYIQQKHPQALEAERWLAAHTERADLRDLFRLFAGPIATTLDNQRKAFLSVAEETPSRNFYPGGATREAIEAFLDANPDRRAKFLDLAFRRSEGGARDHSRRAGGA